MPETTEKERRPPKLDIPIPSPLQPPLDQVEGDETGHPKRGVDGGEMQILQRVDDDLEGFLPRVQALGDTEQGGNLTRGDCARERSACVRRQGPWTSKVIPPTHY
jgi:hypothetical protein